MGLHVPDSARTSPTLWEEKCQALEERNRQLEAENEEFKRHQVSMTVVLDGTGDGIIKCDLGGNIGNVVSSNIISWFGPFDGLKIWQLLFEGNEKRQLQLELELDEIRDDIMPFEVITEQMQNRFHGWDGQAFEFYVRKVDDGGPGSLIFIIKDITAQLEAEELARASAELQEVVARILSDTTGFREFMEEQTRLLEGLQALDPTSSALARTLHTLKGNASLFGLQRFADRCHVLEDLLSEEGPPESVAPWWEILSEEWSTSIGRLGRFLPSETGNVVIRPDEHEALLNHLKQRGYGLEELHIVRELAWQPAEAMLERLGERAQRLASRLGKPLDIEVSANGTRLPRDYLEDFWPTLVHVIRNAVDHGIETPEARQSLGKNERGRIGFHIVKSSSNVTLTIYDDGAGIDWDVLRNKALDQRIAFLDREELLFLDGLSSRDEATDLSGRGVGLADVKARCHAYGGTIEVHSKPNAGTSFRFSFPPPQ